MHRPNSKAISQAKHRDIWSPMLFLLFIAIFYALSIHPAHAANLSVLCVVIDQNASFIIDAVAVTGVLVVGIGATLGKISIQLALTVAVGISIMAATNTIITNLGGQYC